MTEVTAALVICGGLIVLWWFHQRSGRRLAAGRMALVREIPNVVASAEISAGPALYPIVRGTYDGRACRIEPHLDGMAVRKLPVLWLFVTVAAAIPKQQRLSAMMRPSNLEYWSPASELDEIPRPDPSLPDRLIVRGSAGLASVIAAHGDFFADGKGKEILIDGGRVRLVTMIEEADRSIYLVYRQARLSGDPIPAELVENVCARAVAIAKAAEGALKSP